MTRSGHAGPTARTASVRPVLYPTRELPTSGRGPYVVDVDVDAMLEHCLAKPGAWPDNPWEHEHPVIKVGPGERGKIFAFLGAETVGVKSATTRDVADEWLHR